MIYQRASTHPAVRAVTFRKKTLEPLSTEYTILVGEVDVGPKQFGQEHARVYVCDGAMVLVRSDDI